MRQLLLPLSLCFSCLFALLNCHFSAAAVSNYSVSSPDGKIVVFVHVDNGLRYDVEYDGTALLENSAIAMQISNGLVYGNGGKPICSRTESVNVMIPSPYYTKAVVRDNYNQLTMTYLEFSVEFRAYDDAVAYRFVSHDRNNIEVTGERAEFAFAADWPVYVPYVRRPAGDFSKQFNNSFESRYSRHRLSEWEQNHLAFTPLMIEGPNGIKMCVGESDLRNYPGMYLCNFNRGSVLSAVFAPYPKLKEAENKKDHVRKYLVKETENYIARHDKWMDFPWRFIAISRNDIQMADNDIVFKLAAPQAKGYDFSWVKPGMAAWEWWNDWNVYNVDFKAGINTRTYKHYIDFAADNSIPYLIVDEGWTNPHSTDLKCVISDFDMDEIISYAKKKNVGLILWAAYYPFQKDTEEICRYYAKKGICGFKVDFFDSDDQTIPEFLEYAAQLGAKYQLLMDFHGIYKPTGLNRKYPNVVGIEGVYGQETVKWAASADQVPYDVMLPYIRNMAGMMDYTPGAMLNNSEKAIYSSNSAPASVGTRCRQLAEYVVFHVPLGVMCDSPARYIREQECTDFIVKVPTVWDNTIPLEGKVGEYFAVARKKDYKWYVGAMTDWRERDLTLDLSFVGPGSFKMEVFRDGVNADLAASDYVREVLDLPSDRKYEVHLAPGGGCAIRIVPAL